MNSTEMEVMVGSISASNFEDPQFGAALLASQFRDSFFEVQDEASKPTLALINRSRSPLTLFDCTAPDPQKSINADGVNHFVLTVISSDGSSSSVTCLKEMWDQAADECEDFIGGIFTTEFASKDGLALIQVIKAGKWLQLRKHPFVRQDGSLSEVGTPVVEESETGVLSGIVDSMGF